jgi:glutaminyl-tRNA synthetase
MKAGKVATRFPPEPNGYLHIGHAKSICLNFGLAQEFGGTCNLRMDDTNPTKEDVEYVESIQKDVEWLGFDWDDKLLLRRRLLRADLRVRRGAHRRARPTCAA